MKKSLVCGAAFLSMLLGSQQARATQSDNHGIHAVPAPGKVVIDGKLDDWDLSGKVLMCYDVESLKDVYSAQVAMMYDAEALYVGVHWVDQTPMGNSHSPRYRADHAWAGDSLQLRIKTDRVMHVTTWYHAPTDEPGMTISYGKSLTQPFGGGDLQIFRTEGWKMDQGVEMAFRKDDDGKGYTQEIKLPWKVITKDRTYKPGDQLNCGFELLWGETDWPVHRYADNLAEGASSREFFFTNIPAWGNVMLEPKGNLKLPTPPYATAMQAQESTQGPVPISYDLPKDGRVTLAIDDEKGVRVRNLVPALPRTKGPNTEHWDGLDDSGKPVTPGKYAFKAIYHDPVHVNWAMSFASPGNPTWETADGKGAFYGDHTAPEAVAAAGDFVALACPGGEAGKHMIGCDLKGQRLWGIANRGAFFAGRISLATDGKILYVSQDKTGTVYRVDIANGQYAPWDLVARDANGTEYKVLDLKVTEAATDTHPKDGFNVSAVAIHGGVLAVALTRENKIKLLDGKTGAVKAELAIDQPRTVTFEKDGGLIVLSNDRLVRLGADGKMTAFADGAFGDGFSLASDANGNVYLSVRGNDQNVKVFTPDGKLDHEIGRRGGRPTPGPFDDNAMARPAQIAIDGQGRLWVTEELQNPKRTSVWSADGKFLFDLVGTTSYSGAGAINPDDPTMAFSDNAVYRLDWAKGTSRPVYSLGKSSSPEDLFATEVDSHVRILTHDGRPYVYTTDRNGDVNCMTLRDGKWLSTAHTGTVNPADRDHPGLYSNPVFAGHEGQPYTWIDRNGDGLVQEDELAFGSITVDGKPAKMQGCYWGQLPGPDGTISYFDSGSGSLIQLPVKGWNAVGSPVYDIANPRVVKVGKTLGNNLGMVLGGQDGTVYLNQTPLMGVDKTGQILFTYPSNHISTHGSHTATAARPGYLIGPSSILGTADMGPDIGEIFNINGNLGENYMYTRDGLFIQAIFKDTRGWFEMPDRAVRGMSMDAITAGGESFGGNFVRTKDGHVYLTIGNTDARVLELTGLDTIRRFSGKIEYTSEEFAAAQKINQESAARAQESKSAKVAKTNASMVLDGKLEQWPELADESKPAIQIQDNPQNQFARVAARYDNDNLYLAYRVKAGASRMRNSGQDERLLFKTGDAVDLMIGPAKSKSGEGNTRLLMSVMKDNNIAELYQKVVPGTVADKRIPFSSPWRTIHFDRVEQQRDVRTLVAPIGGGYLVEAAIPWKVLGIAPQSGLKLRGDFGVLAGDSGGTATVSRKYWSNKATGLVNDVPGEADLTPELWGNLELE